MIKVRLGVGTKHTVMKIKKSTLKRVLDDKDEMLAKEVGQKLCRLIMNGILADAGGRDNGR